MMSLCYPLTNATPGSTASHVIKLRIIDQILSFSSRSDEIYFYYPKFIITTIMTNNTPSLT